MLVCVYISFVRVLSTRLFTSVVNVTLDIKPSLTQRLSRDLMHDIKLSLTQVLACDLMHDIKLSLTQMLSCDLMHVAV